MVAPTYTHYRIDASVDGVPVVFSDDSSIGVPAAGGAAIEFFVQGIDVDPVTGDPVVGASPSPGRMAVGSGSAASLNDDERTGFRWNLIADRSVGAQVVVDRVEIAFNY